MRGTVFLQRHLQGLRAASPLNDVDLALNMGCEALAGVAGAAGIGAGAGNARYPGPVAVMAVPLYQPQGTSYIGQQSE